MKRGKWFTMLAGAALATGLSGAVQADTLASQIADEFGGEMSLSLSAVDKFFFNVIQNDNDSDPGGYINAGDYIEAFITFSSLDGAGLTSGSVGVNGSTPENITLTAYFLAEVTGLTQTSDGTPLSSTGDVGTPAGGVSFALAPVTGDSTSFRNQFNTHIAGDTLSSLGSGLDNAMYIFFEDEGPTTASDTDPIGDVDTILDGLVWAVLGPDGSAGSGAFLDGTVGNSDSAQDIIGVNDPDNFITPVGGDFGFNLQRIDQSGGALTDVGGLYEFNAGETFLSSGGDLFATTSASGYDFFGQTDVAFKVTIIPTPAAAWIGLAGFGMMGLVRRKRRN